MDTPRGIFQGTLAALRDYLSPHRLLTMSASPDRSSAGILSAPPSALRPGDHTPAIRAGTPHGRNPASLSAIIG